MNLKVFIQNEAGSTEKHYHNENTFEWRRKDMVSRPFPYPYGFILGTTSTDGANLDCWSLPNTASRRVILWTAKR